MSNPVSDFLKPTPILRKLQILRLICQDPKRSQNQLAKDLDFSVSAVNRIVRELQSDGALLWREEGWFLTKEGNRLMLELTAAYNSELESLFSLHNSPEPQPSKSIKIGTLRSLGTAVPLVARKLNLFGAASLNVEIQLYDYAVDMLADLLNGRLSFAYGGMAAFLESKRKALHVEILAACNSGGHALVVKRGLGIASIEDLEGSTLLVPPESTMTYRLFSTFLENRYPSLLGQIRFDSTVSPTNMPFALEFNEHYAAMVSWEPWVSFAETRFDDLQVMVDFVHEWRDAVGRPYSTTVLVSLPNTVVEKHDLVQTVLKIHETAIDFLNEQPQQANELLSEVLSMPLDVIERARTRVFFSSALQW